MRKIFVWISLLSVAFASAARGQEYRAEVITPPSGFVPFNFDDGVGRAVGQWPVGQETHAAVWDVAGGSVVDLQPAGYGLSTANASQAGQQAGYAFSPDGQTQRAMLWRGTAASRVDLHPAGSSSSLASDTDGTVQVGSAVFGSNRRGGMWRGTAASWVDLTPTHRGYANARVNATYGGRHVGGAGNLGTPNLAFLWQDTAQSAVPLRPTGTFVSSEALGIHGNQQVGESFTVNLFTGHATVWSGTSDSGVDLHPNGYATSRAVASNGLLQVGSAALGSGAAARLHAALWAGTADSFIDLHALLPAGRFEHSGAFAVDEAGNVYGTATGATGPASFVVWSVVPEPSALVLAAVPAVAALRRRHTRRGSA